MYEGGQIRKNIEFKRYDLRNGALGSFDVVFSMAVIYCIADESLESFFEVLASNVKSTGSIFVGCVSNIPVFQLIKNLIKNIFIKFGIMKWSHVNRGVKQSGWVRSSREVKKYIPSKLKVDRLFNTHHFHVSINAPSFVCRISQNIIPLTNVGYLFLLKSNLPLEGNFQQTLNNN